MLSIERKQNLSCTTASAQGHAMYGFDMPLEASIAATYANEHRAKHLGDNDEEYGMAIVMSNELNWAAICAWDRFCGRRI